MAVAEKTTDTAQELATSVRPARSGWQLFWRAFRGHKPAMISLALLGLLVLVSIIAPVIAPYGPREQNLRERLQPPSSTYILGTDHYGRDVFSRILYGGRYSLTIGLISVSISLSIGLTLGLLAGYAGNWVDTVVMRFTDVLLAFPGILLAIIITAMLGPSLVNLMIAVGIGATPRYIRVVRGATLSAKEEQYVEAVRALGAKPFRIIVHHILPNIWAPVMVVATLGIATAILSGAGLAYLGLGPEPGTPEWGAMLSEAREFIRRAWWATTFPGLAITITVLAINLIGDGLRDALDPQLRER